MKKSKEFKSTCPCSNKSCETPSGTLCPNTPCGRVKAKSDAIKKAQERKRQPVASGVLAYFPNAILSVANASLVGNEQHNPGQHLHWDMDKSKDEADALLRHLIDHLSGEPIDDDGVPHLSKVCWRALALLERDITNNK